MLPVVAAALSLLAVGLLGRAWYRDQWSLSARAHVTLVGAGLAVLCGLCRYWNLVQFPF